MGMIKLSLVVIVALALWPTLVSAQPPKPKGTLVFDDDFSSPKSGLEDNLQATDYSRGFHAPGVYHLILLKNDDTRWSLIPRLSLGTYSFEMDLWDNSDAFTGDVASGAIFNAKDDTHFYTVLLDPRTGEYAVRKLNGKDTWTDLVAWKASPLVKQQAEVNHLRVDAEGGKFTIYLNGQSLDSFSDASYASGKFGLIAGNVDASKPHMHFDNVKVYTTEAVVTALPNTGAQGGDHSPVLALVGLLLLGAGALVLRSRASR
jgi:hypothetical protein